MFSAAIDNISDTADRFKDSVRIREIHTDSVLLMRKINFNFFKMDWKIVEDRINWDSHMEIIIFYPLSSVFYLCFWRVNTFSALLCTDTRSHSQRLNVFPLKVEVVCRCRTFIMQFPFDETFKRAKIVLVVWPCTALPRKLLKEFLLSSHRVEFYLSIIYFFFLRECTSYILVR